MEKKTRVNFEKYSLLIPSILLLIPGIYILISIGIAYFLSEIYLIKLYSGFTLTSHFLFGVLAPVAASILLFVFDHHLSQAKKISNSLHKLTDLLIVISNLSILIGISFFIYRCFFV